jgi:hypothetical protein
LTIKTLHDRRVCDHQDDDQLVGARIEKEPLVGKLAPLLAAWFRLFPLARS